MLLIALAGLGAGAINSLVGSGTLITFEEDENMEQAVVSGIAFNRDEAKVTLLGVPDKPGIAYQILGPVAEANIDIDVIIQNVSHDGKTDFSFTVHRNDYQRAFELLKSEVVPALGAAAGFLAGAHALHVLRDGAQPIDEVAVHADLDERV